jgi:hypothetical protein
MKQIETIHLFPQLTDELLNLLRNIDESDWLKSSPIKGRTVKDLVSHIIDGSLRKLSIQRDGFTDKTNIPNIQSYNELVNHIQTLNSDWINVSRRLSPEILIDLLEYFENQFNQFIKTLNPNDTAIFPVSWAGDTESQNWFDIAREYTEVWHHQMQIRLALKKPILMDKKFTEPLYDTFMRGLPYLYKDFTDIESGYKIKISLTGTIDKSWFLERQPEKWVLIEKETEIGNTSVELPDDVAWKIFTNTDREKEKYKSIIKINGDDRIGLKLLDFVTVMS